MRETAFSPALPSNRHFKLRVTQGGRKTQRKDARLGTKECLPSFINRFKMPCQRGERGKETEDTGPGEGTILGLSISSWNRKERDSNNKSLDFVFHFAKVLSQ